jgi:lipoprotein-anchoring transpeptidase ErfK/SrfK
MKTVLLLALPVLLASCSLIKSGRPLFETAKAEPVVPETPTAPEPDPVLYEWNGSRIPGSPSVKIDLSEQKARIYKAGQEVGWTYVATGTTNHRTPTGSFRIMEKKADKRSNLWGIVQNSSGGTINSNARNGSSHIPKGGKFVGAPMPHWMRLTSSGIGMHGGPIPNPGSPASHGCIRLPYGMAEQLFAELPSGTPVTVSY